MAEVGLGVVKAILNSELYVAGTFCNVNQALIVNPVLTGVNAGRVAKPVPALVTVKFFVTLNASPVWSVGVQVRPELVLEVWPAVKRG